MLVTAIATQKNRMTLRAFSMERKPKDWLAQGKLLKRILETIQETSANSPGSNLFGAG
jgi:hypothetical protein